MLILEIFLNEGAIEGSSGDERQAPRDETAKNKGFGEWYSLHTFVNVYQPAAKAHSGDVVVRRTKEEALATRHKLLDAAEHLFQAQGVSRTSLQDIARRAGATRGAVYWHFKDKADLFNAMMDRVLLPMENALQEARGEAPADPLPQLRTALLAALRRTETDPQTRRVFEVATQKVEYIPALGKVRERHLAVRTQSTLQIKQVLQRSARARGLRLPIPAPAAARGLHALVDGLIQGWLLDPQSFRLEAAGRQAIDAYLAGLGLRESAAA
jgi:TetR/AcrR family acrAB operon transcriptional repressor